MLLQLAGRPFSLAPVCRAEPATLSGLPSLQRQSNLGLADRELAEWATMDPVL